MRDVVVTVVLIAWIAGYIWHLRRLRNHNTRRQW